MPVQYKGRFGGLHMRRYGRYVYKQFKEFTGPQGGKYFLRGRNHHKVYHKNIKTRNLGFTGQTNKLGRKIYGSRRGGYRVIKQAGSFTSFLRPKMNRSFFTRL